MQLQKQENAVRSHMLGRVYGLEFNKLYLHCQNSSKYIEQRVSDVHLCCESVSYKHTEDEYGYDVYYK